MVERGLIDEEKSAEHRARLEAEIAEQRAVGPLLEAFPVRGDVDGLEIVPAHQQRQWMNEHPMEEQHDPDKIEKGLANRCLPLLMANQMGWNVVNTRDFMATSTPDGRMLYHWEQPPPREGGPRPNFKVGNLITWPSPWTFKTPPGWDLLILPPPNVHLPTGVTCLSALVETDHVPATFTFNWRVEPGLSVWIAAGDVVCRLLPYQTAELEQFSLKMHDGEQPGYQEWLRDRSERLQKLLTPGNRWERPYFQIAKRKKLARRP